MSDVIFPVFGCGKAQLATVRCDRLDPKDYPAGRALVLARDEREIERILADARSNETSGAEIATPIWVRFIPQQFTGRSYGLALALADKFARYRAGRATDGTRYFATGIVKEDGSGEICKVDAFDEKLAAIVAEAKRGDIVILPKGNLDRALLEASSLLDRLNQKGVFYRAIDHLDQLIDLLEWSSIEPGTRSNDRVSRSWVDETADWQRRQPFDRQAAGADDPTSIVDVRALPQKNVIPPTRTRSGSGSVVGIGMIGAAVVVAGAAALTGSELLGLRSLIASPAEEPVLILASNAKTLLTNPSFEAGKGQDPVGWVTYSRGEFDHADKVREGGVDGGLLLEHSSDGPFYVDTYQMVSLPNGYYTMSAWINSYGKKKRNRMYARTAELYEIDIPETGPKNFQKLEMHCIPVTETRLAIGFYIDTFDNSSAAYDNVQLVQNDRKPDGQPCAEN